MTNDEAARYGRILGLLLHVDEHISPQQRSLYVMNPRMQFGPLMIKANQKHGAAWRRYDNRIGVILDGIETLDEAPKVIPLQQQGIVQLACAKEQSFHRQTLGQRIAEGRKALNLTQEELADRAGISRVETIARYENEALTPTKENRQALRDVLGYEYI